MTKEETILILRALYYLLCQQEGYFSEAHKDCIEDIETLLIEKCGLGLDD